MYLFINEMFWFLLSRISNADQKSAFLLLLARIHTDSGRIVNNYKAINNVLHVEVMSIDKEAFWGSMINII